jgi:hypothetical protein
MLNGRLQKEALRDLTVRRTVKIRQEGSGCRFRL